jgi:ribosomal protein S1
MAGDEVYEEFDEAEDEGNEDEVDEMAAALEEMGDLAAPKSVGKGDLVDAVVAEVQADAVVVDLGTKYEGFVPRSEFATEEEIPAVGETIKVAVVNIDEKKERIRASKRRADYERVWGELQEALEQNTTLTAMVTERVRGGLRVNVGVPGFVPASQVQVRDVRQLDRFVGRSLPLKVLELERGRNKIILSHRKAVDEERDARRARTLEKLYEGAVCEGKVVNLTKYGAFIDLGGLDGLLHISEMAWHHVDDPSEIVQKGDIVRVVVQSIENDGDRISLSRREILPDPWKEIESHYEIDQVIEVEITRLVATGAFARLDEIELEGFIPRRELSLQNVKKPEEAVQVGDRREAKIIGMEPAARKLTLSLAQTEEAAERQEAQAFMTATNQSGTSINLGEQFGDILAAALDESTEGPTDPEDLPSLEEPVEAVVDAAEVKASEEEGELAPEEEAPAEPTEEAEGETEETSAAAVEAEEEEAPVEEPAAEESENEEEEPPPSGSDAADK